MSTFCGQMREYSRISLDRFDKENLESTAFFLSHCHTDHMVGLSYPSFLYRLNSCRDIKLYCSEVTRQILLHMQDGNYKHLDKHVVALSENNPTRLRIPNFSGKAEEVVVTLIPAAHCPGSVMFLFEGEEGTVLYTGDFRLEKGSAARIPQLNSGSRSKNIRSLYVDTTFCTPKAFHIPSRQECRDVIISVIDSWIQLSPAHMVVLKGKASLGYEYIYEEVNKEFKQKIHISERKMKMYTGVPQISKCFTTDPTGTQVHACEWQFQGESSTLPCGHKLTSGDDPRVLTILMSTMWFTQEVRPHEIICGEKGFYRTCFSFHSSYQEIRDFVSYLQPCRVFPNVIPVKEDLEKVQKRLNSFLKLPHLSRGTIGGEYKPLGMLNRKWFEKRRKKTSATSTENSEELDLSDTPPKKRSRKNLQVNSGKGDSNGDGMEVNGLSFSPDTVKGNFMEARGNDDDNDNSQEQREDSDSYITDEEIDRFSQPEGGLDLFDEEARKGDGDHQAEVVAEDQSQKEMENRKVESVSLSWDCIFTEYSQSLTYMSDGEEEEEDEQVNDQRKYIKNGCHGDQEETLLVNGITSEEKGNNTQTNSEMHIESSSGNVMVSPPDFPSSGKSVLASKNTMPLSNAADSKIHSSKEQLENDVVIDAAAESSCKKTVDDDILNTSCPTDSDVTISPHCSQQSIEGRKNKSITDSDATVTPQCSQDTCLNGIEGTTSTATSNVTSKKQREMNSEKNNGENSDLHKGLATPDDKNKDCDSESDKSVNTPEENNDDIILLDDVAGSARAGFSRYPFQQRFRDESMAGSNTANLNPCDMTVGAFFAMRSRQKRLERLLEIEKKRPHLTAALTNNTTLDGSIYARQGNPTATTTLRRGNAPSEDDVIDLTDEMPLETGTTVRELLSDSDDNLSSCYDSEEIFSDDSDSSDHLIKVGHVPNILRGSSRVRGIGRPVPFQSFPRVPFPKPPRPRAIYQSDEVIVLGSSDEEEEEEKKMSESVTDSANPQRDHNDQELTNRFDIVVTDSEEKQSAGVAGDPDSKSSASALHATADKNFSLTNLNMETSFKDSVADLSQDVCSVTEKCHASDDGNSVLTKDRGCKQTADSPDQGQQPSTGASASATDSEEGSFIVEKTPETKKPNSQEILKLQEDIAGGKMDDMFSAVKKRCDDGP
ncbi:protein artemis-like [Lingula anatina]|uniref:Protein artemis n=1 Tax=Lingula anatina TaxID=7574 RepID=A0A1S3JNK7_LINAN|nr:protein artemis-like [Lingula anatina]|eukprot:XP_013411942.1 protein artemis-like [Lingula anatina]